MGIFVCDMEGLAAGVEMGGTSVKVCTVSLSDPLTIMERTVIPTTSPEETLEKVRAWLADRKHHLKAIGVAAFGPVELRRDHAAYGSITTTPKLAWQHTDVLTPLKTLGVASMGFDTDVNAPARLEAARMKCEDVCYITVGTGVGVGAVV